MKINKDLIYGFLVTVLISAFAYSVGNIFKENSEKQVSEIRKIQEVQKQERKSAEEREKAANYKRDSALTVLERQTGEIHLINQNFSNLNFNILSMRTLYDKNFTDLKKLQNEKDHISNASLSEQFDFLSKYRYQEYSGGTNP
ncbi:hypothetical protein [Chryseobacterium bernardetii]|uniref:hypothetical protein n=1 Tax=Chryseobacterium bernardetii TaxID=1241978 RepID=UPI001623FA39|nr:hypothetical protein [Chryseobacterium bernardetii]